MQRTSETRKLSMNHQWTPDPESITELISQFREEARWLEERAEEGWELEDKRGNLRAVKTMAPKNGDSYLKVDLEIPEEDC